MEDAGDMPQQTEHTEQTDIHVPEPTGPREPTDRGTDHEYEFDAIDAIQANEDGFYSQRELMNYARLKRKNPIEEDFNIFLENHTVPEQMSREELIFHGDEFWGTLNDPEEDLRMAFAEIDKDGTGTVDKEELRNFLQNNGADRLTDEELDDIFDHLDANEDGTLSSKELKELLL